MVNWDNKYGVLDWLELTPWIQKAFDSIPWVKEAFDKKDVDHLNFELLMLEGIDTRNSNRYAEKVDSLMEWISLCVHQLITENSNYSWLEQTLIINT